MTGSHAVTHRAAASGVRTARTAIGSITYARRHQLSVSARDAGTASAGASRVTFTFCRWELEGGDE